MRFSVSSLLTLAVAATAVVAQPSKRAFSLNPPKDYIHEVKWDELAPAPTEAVTNAKRFAQGLPPLNPRRRNPNRGVHHGAAHARHGTRVASAPRAETSPSAPTPHTCNILVKNASSGEELGYISKEWNEYAEYGPLESGQDDALEVSFSASPDTRTDQIDLITTNGKSAAHPFLGATVGYASDDDDLGPGDADYLLLVGTTQTPPGSTPSLEANNSFSEVSEIHTSSESGIWSFDPVSRAFEVRWTNTDKSVVGLHILWSNEEENDLFTLTADPVALKEKFGGNAPVVTFTCVTPTVAV